MHSLRIQSGSGRLREGLQSLLRPRLEKARRPIVPLLQQLQAFLPPVTIPFPISAAALHGWSELWLLRPGG
ncbi:unnamed protein product [Cuscuta epithymum]|uniref:Uncharacterized protein n=1 Tax=Cuscuta epithymum TaxID=186058 RepID=A0AAV0CCP0_9ASTE|nr:unnamed protein product [Cuscuta epithymum]